MSSAHFEGAQQVYLRLERVLRVGDLTKLPLEISTAPGYPNTADPYTHTPLLALAISWAPPLAVQQLLRQGADPNFEALDGFPALLGAVMAKRDDTRALLQVLIEAGADLDRQGINGWTALHAAANCDDAASATLLLERGANPQVRTGVDSDDTALDEARRARAQRVIEVLSRVTD
jgi:ankyrin repeat protein